MSSPVEKQPPQAAVWLHIFGSFGKTRGLPISAENRTHFCHCLNSETWLRKHWRIARPKPELDSSSCIYVKPWMSQFVFLRRRRTFDCLFHLPHSCNEVSMSASLMWDSWQLFKWGRLFIGGWVNQLGLLEIMKNWCVFSLYQIIEQQKHISFWASIWKCVFSV